MITIRTNTFMPDGSPFIDAEFTVCTNWSEVNIEKLCAANTFKEYVATLTTMPAKILELSTDLQLEPIYTLISFIDDLDVIPIIKAGSVQLNTYDQLELTRLIIKSGRKSVCMIRAARVYYPDEKNPVRLIGLGADIIQQLDKFLKSYKEMFDGEIDTLKELAGIHGLAAFGPWATAYVIAGRDILKLKEIFKLPAIQVYTGLLFNHRESEYHKKHKELSTPGKRP